MKEYGKIDPDVYTRLGDYLYFDVKNYKEALLSYKKRIEAHGEHLRSDYMIYICSSKLNKNEGENYYEILKKKYGKALDEAERTRNMNEMMNERSYYPEDKAILDAFGE